MDYQLLDALIQEKQQNFYQVSDQIWSFAEMRYQEFQSARLQKEVLTQEGFTIEENLGGIPTAFRAKFGHGKPVVAFLGEFDALPNLSQQADVTSPSPITRVLPDMDADITSSALAVCRQPWR
jgi:aminobenzoyl-glutamate utilization protein B